MPLRGGRILDASVYMAVQHEELGDLVGTVGHADALCDVEQPLVARRIHKSASLIYSDYPFDIRTRLTKEYPPDGTRRHSSPPLTPHILKPDGPLMLSAYTGAKAEPIWTLDMVDNAAAHTGLVYQAEVHVKPMPPSLLNGQTIAGTVAGPGQDFYPLDLPNDATKVTLTMKLPGGANPDIQLLVRKDILPSATEFDFGTNFASTATATITFDPNSQPPLIPGEYIVGIINSEFPP